MTPPRYRVVWLHSVRAVWVGHLLLQLSARGESSDPVFQAIDELTEKLAIDPDLKGESRPDERRIIHRAPITVTYEVHPDEQVEIVVHAHYVRRPGSASG